MNKFTPIVIALVLALSPAAAFGGGPKDTSPGNSGEHKVTICHHAGPTKTITITVDEDAVAKHISQHGDTVGPCPTTTPPPPPPPDTTPTPTPNDVPPTPTVPVTTPDQPVYEVPAPVQQPSGQVVSPSKQHGHSHKRPARVTPHKPAAAVTAPQTHAQLVKQAGAESLPYTGLPAGVLGAFGLLLLAGGLALQRKLITI